jgi:hypothetical protein
MVLYRGLRRPLKGHMELAIGHLRVLGALGLPDLDLLGPAHCKSFFKEPDVRQTVLPRGPDIMELIDSLAVPGNTHFDELEPPRVPKPREGVRLHPQILPRRREIFQARHRILELVGKTAHLLVDLLVAVAIGLEDGLVELFVDSELVPARSTDVLGVRHHFMGLALQECKDPEQRRRAEGLLEELQPALEYHTFYHLLGHRTTIYY